MYLKYFLESGIFAQDSKDSESRTLFYFVTDPSCSVYSTCDITVCSDVVCIVHVTLVAMQQ